MITFRSAALLGVVLAASYSSAGMAAPHSLTEVGRVVSAQSQEVSAARRGGGRAGATNVNRRSTTNVNVNKRTNVNVNKRTNVNVNRRTNVNVNVARRPVRGWVRRPYYGTVVAGVALGTVIAVSAAGTAPVVPGPNMCWFWTNASMSNGYWDYCVAP